MSSTYLITGSNRGIGLALTAHLLESEPESKILACCRSPENAEHLKGLQELFQDRIEVHAVDVSDEGSIKALADTLSDRAVDVIVNNAGVDLERDELEWEDCDQDLWTREFQVNTFGPVLLFHHLKSQLLAGGQKKVLNVSSRLGSVSNPTDVPHVVVYGASKAALNSAFTRIAREVYAEGISVLCVHPGVVATDLNPQGAPMTPQESAANLADRIRAMDLEQSGSFVNYDGSPLAY